MKNQLETIFNKISEAVRQVSELKQLEDIRVKALGRKGELTRVLQGLKDLPPAARREVGQIANVMKGKLLRHIETRVEELKRASWTADSQLRPDPTLPGRPPELGREHILNRTTRDIEDIFRSLGFTVVEGPEVETDYYNFGAMNFPVDHPSRDMHDTLFISGDVLLRTHTSPVQVRYMERQSPPLRAIMPGKTYRCDDDATHSPMFHQVEGLMVDRDVSFADLKAVLTIFIRRMFGPDAQLRFRPSFFPFTEPSAEIDMACVKCRGKGCNLCKGTGWIEILGAGMVHPQVLRAGRIDPETHTGFAFGMGIERVAMLKYGIDHLRYFFENDLRFLRQF